ncbi:unnamed protein product [Blepharisma stoltei]|uniref:EF-hand domain-containing protein n=1 Tax=Blepharisma stoltei TaxID=1481888 RepID=A0AAU9K568_9CILI|nr:unnamed protein product [Blepharisma stoltei]
MDRRLSFSKSHSVAVLIPRRMSDSVVFSDDAAIQSRKFQIQKVKKSKYNMTDRHDLAEDEIKLIFSILDPIKNGHLTPDDLLITLKQSDESIANSDIKTFFDIVDEDLDSIITYEEFYTLMNS